MKSGGRASALQRSFAIVHGSHFFVIHFFVLLGF
jgi:hypothetical protein